MILSEKLVNYIDLHQMFGIFDTLWVQMIDPNQRLALIPPYLPSVDLNLVKTWPKICRFISKPKNCGFSASTSDTYCGHPRPKWFEKKLIPDQHRCYL